MSHADLITHEFNGAEVSTDLSFEAVLQRFTRTVGSPRCLKSTKWQ
jgi:hypothetical protein